MHKNETQLNFDTSVQEATFKIKKIKTTNKQKKNVKIYLSNKINTKISVFTFVSLSDILTSHPLQLPPHTYTRTHILVYICTLILKGFRADLRVRFCSPLNVWRLISRIAVTNDLDVHLSSAWGDGYMYVRDPSHTTGSGSLNVRFFLFWLCWLALALIPFRTCLRWVRTLVQSVSIFFSFFPIRGGRV